MSSERFRHRYANAFIHARLWQAKSAQRMVRSAGTIFADHDVVRSLYAFWRAWGWRIENGC